MRLYALTAISAFALIAARGTTHRAAQSTPCRGPDAFSTRAVADMKRLVTTTDPLMVSFRTTVGLPAVAADQVTLVSDSTVCRQVVSAYDSASQVPAPTDGLYVLQVGGNYVAADPSAPAGEWVTWFRFDSTFAFQTSYYR
jgi:hypothetical protein